MTTSAQSCGRCGRDSDAASNFCSHCGQALRPTARLTAYTPRHLADRILTSRAALEGERKQVTVLFADIKGSMDLARRIGPEEWHALLDRFFAVLAEGVHHFEGTINQFTGDGVMALFGAPLAHEDHAQRACHAALRVREQLRPLAQDVRRTRGLRLAVRMGLNSGEVVVGRIGDDLRMDYTAQGHTVGLAARMEQSAAADRIYLTEQTAALVGGLFALDDLGSKRVKGTETPCRVFALAGPGPLHTRLDVARERGLERFLGRGDEIALLGQALTRAVAGHAQVVGVVGAPGVGKSRLCQEFVDQCRAQNIAVAAAHCPSHGRALPYFAAVELLRSYFGVSPDDPRRPAQARVTRELRRLGAGLKAQAPFALDVLGMPSGQAKDLPDAERRERLFALVEQLVQTHSAAAPLVLLVDDAHWLDAESDALLARLVQAVGWTRTLLLLNFRPEYHPSWTGVSYFQRLELGPLPAVASDDLLVQLLGADEASAPLRALVRDRAQGNPFFLEEIVHSLAQQGILLRSRERAGAPRYEVKAGIEAGDVPPEIPATIQALLAARIDRLPEGEKSVLQTAAVVGRRFTLPLLHQTLRHLADATPCPADPAELAAALAALQSVDFVEPHGDDAEEFGFRHPLVREVAYNALLRDRRARIHEAVAQTLEVAYADRLGAQAALIAHHWTAADKRAEAGLWRYRAALQVTRIQPARSRTRTPPKPT